MPSDEDLLKEMAVIARKAGEAIMVVYAQDDHGVELKNDESPLTQADKNANEVINAELAKLTPDIPIVSEENDPADNQTAYKAKRFWLIDPVDGTSDFIKRNGEFTVNIALIEDGQPHLGVVYLPATDVLYAGGTGLGAWRSRDGQALETIKVSDNKTITKVAVSRSHLDSSTTELLDHLSPPPEIIRAGSALKLCLVADGSVDVHFRMSSGMQGWDTAAGDAVVRAAGGRIVNLRGQPLRYDGSPHPEHVCDNGQLDLDPLIKG